MKLLVLVGSLRSGSLNAALAEAALTGLPDDVVVTRWNRLAELPHYDQTLDVDPVSEAVADFRHAVADADAVLIATPEYNGAMSSAIKNAIDWGSRPRGSAALAGKPVAVVSATGSPRGGQWARESTVRSLTIAGARPLEQTVGVGLAHEHLLGDGPDDPGQLDALRALVGELIEAARVPQPVSA